MQASRPIRGQLAPALSPALDRRRLHAAAYLPLLIACLGLPRPAAAEMRTWDARHAIDQIQVTMVYFVPRDRTPLPDWRERLDYYARRIGQFHSREFQGQSTLVVDIHPQPFLSEKGTAQLRDGDADHIFFETLREVDDRLDFGASGDGSFPILLVLSEINWRPLDDYFRLKPGVDGPEFEGNYSGGQHFPGAASGGARATYLAREGKGWGLVSADGWRVPYRGSDCVIYHEGCGHTIGLPHTQPADGSVMSLAQYRGWISESWIDREQKSRLGWNPPEAGADISHDLFTQFRALVEPAAPRPGEGVELHFDWPEQAKVSRLRVRIQTELLGPWIELPANVPEGSIDKISLGAFDRPTPVSYRVDAELADGQATELWGYFQVRKSPDVAVIPPFPLAELASSSSPADPVAAPLLAGEVDVLSLIDPPRDAVSGEWSIVEGRLVAPRAYGARLELPVDVPDSYELTVVAEPLDAPNGFILGQRMGARRFLVLLNYTPDSAARSALENVDGANVGNATTHTGGLFEQGRRSRIQAAVRPGRVTVTVDGSCIIDWTGDPESLSLSDYWSTPHGDRLFLGAYDCGYRIHQLTLRPLSSADRVK